MITDVNKAMQTRFRTLLALLPVTPAIVMAALGAVALVLVFWWMEHNAQLRSEGALRKIQRQTNVQVTGLQAKADSAIRGANQTNVRVISDLLVARGRLEQQVRDLSSCFAGLQLQEQTHGRRSLYWAPRRLHAGWKWNWGPALCKKGFGVRSEDGSQDSGVGSREEGRPGILSARSELRTPSPGLPPANPESLNPNPGLMLTEAGAREVVQSLSELSSCRGESRVQTEQLSSCQQQTTANAQIAVVQKSPIARLNEALAEKDQVLSKRQAEFKTGLRVARGTVLWHVARLTEHVAIGVAIGWVLRTR